MHILSFMMGSTVEASLAKPVLRVLMAWFLSHTFLIRLIRIPVHAFPQASLSMMGLCFPILTVPPIFSIGNIAFLFQESRMHPPARAAFAMSLCETRNPGGASLSISVVTSLPPRHLPFRDVLPVVSPLMFSGGGDVPVRQRNNPSVEVGDE